MELMVADDNNVSEIERTYCFAEGNPLFKALAVSEDRGNTASVLSCTSVRRSDLFS